MACSVQSFTTIPLACFISRRLERENQSSTFSVSTFSVMNNKFTLCSKKDASCFGFAGLVVLLKETIKKKIVPD